MNALQEKKKRLETYIRQFGSVAVAFSAGVDSTFLLKIAHDALGAQAIAITVRSSLFPECEFEEAADFCRAERIEQCIVDLDALSIKGFCQNPKDRCYLCKREMFANICDAARRRDIAAVFDGSNGDDCNDYRPGLKAVKEMGIKSPLMEVRFTKAEIRRLSKELGLTTFDKPAFACLASRFVYGETITKEKLFMVQRAEQRLFELGLKQARVRIHGNIARIEVNQSDFSKIAQKKTANEISQYFHELGFLYVTLDLDGYQMGSMNKTIE